ncbi:MAG: hypothetical protein IKE23_08600, partial [Exiguobacterium sp.]|nr:hypothetical protein [Exiguobacterium sp.]
MCPIQNYRKHEPTQDKMLEIPQPAIGGLNLKDLEYEQDVSQSPQMLNVMYRNGAFSKRYGQNIYSSYEDEVYAITQFGGNIFAHAGDSIYLGETNVMGTESISLVETRYTLPEASGIFIVFQQKLYYMVSKVVNDDLAEGSGFWEYKKVGDDYVFVPMDTYIPDLTINCHPDGQGGDSLEQTNVIGNKFRLIYNGTGDTSDYIFGTYDPDNIIKLKDSNNNIIPPEVIVYGKNNDQPLPYDSTLTVANSFKVVLDDQDSKNNKVVFSFQPEEGDLNVEMVFQMKESVQEKALIETLSCKYYDTYGGQYNSRVFLAGDGQSRYYWSASYDITYWPSLNYAKLGNTEDDITGLGRQYNALIAFKPRETFQIVSYTETTFSELLNDIDTESFRSSLVNPIIGCDSPYSIQVINNLLTWFNSMIGVCTLVSTNLADERNIRVLSRNVEKTNNFNVKGLLDMQEDPLNIRSADFDKKYFLVFPTSGTCFVWDYEISPYFYSSANGETPPAKLTWFLFDHFYVKQFVNTGKELLYISSYINGADHTYKNIFSMGGWETRNYATAGVVDGVCHCIFAGEGQSYAGVLKTFSATQGHRYYISYKISNMNVGDLTVNGKSVPPTDGFVQKTSLANAGTTNTFELMARQSGQCEIKEIMFIDMTAVYGSDIPALEKLDEIYGSAYHAYNVSNTIFIGVDMQNSLVKLNSSFADLDFDGDGVNDGINSYYMTPFMQFGAVEWLKNVRYLYVQCRGDTN